MTTLAELLTDVYKITKRPDLVDMTTLAVKSATLKAHHSDFYPKDLFETAIQWNPVAYTQSLDYKAIVPKWRAFKYLRKFDYTTPPGEAGKFFEIITPEEVLDKYQIQREDVCYLAGAQLEIKSSTEDEYMLLGCYVHPTITDAGYSSWVADEYPFAIIYAAAADVFKQIGFDEQAARIDRQVMEQLMLLRNSNVLAQGY